MAIAKTPDLSRYRDGLSIGYLLNRTAHLVAATFEEELRKDGITLPVWRVLTALTSLDGQSLSQLATHAGAELSYLSRVVSGAAARGLVTRIQSSTDKRATNVSISAKGRQLVRKFAPRANELDRTCLSGIQQADADTLRKLLRQVYDNVLSSYESADAQGRKLKVARRVSERPGQLKGT